MGRKEEEWMIDQKRIVKEDRSEEEGNVERR